MFVLMGKIVTTLRMLLTLNFLGFNYTFFFFVNCTKKAKSLFSVLLKLSQEFLLVGHKVPHFVWSYHRNFKIGFDNLYIVEFILKCT